MGSSVLAWWHVDTTKFLPVVHDVTFRILILVLIVFGLKAKIVDVETAFVYGNIEEILMKCPPGMTDAEEDDALALNKCIYGLGMQSDSIIRRLLKFCKNWFQLRRHWTLIHVCSGNNMKREMSLLQDNKQPWELIWFSDSDYARDPDSRKRIISGFVLFVCEIPISCGFKAQCSVAFSSSEAKEVMFVLQLLQSIKIKVKFPIIVSVDNVGAIFMTKNITTTWYSKHVDISYKFVTEFIQDGIIKVISFKSANDSDIVTKNLGSELHSKNAGKLFSMKEIL